MVTKMMLMVIGRQPVRVSIPDGSDRAWLYYGRKASAFAGSTSYRSVVLHPCRNKKRTVFPGGIRVKGGQPVRLLVSPLGKDAARVLPLGRPKTLADGR